MKMQLYGKVTKIIPEGKCVEIDGDTDTKDYLLFENLIHLTSDQEAEYNKLYQDSMINRE